jgi:putative hemolysin
MVPALDVRWLDAGLAVGAALDEVLEAPHGRYPVGAGSLDNLEGIVHVRDLLAAARRDRSTSVGGLARPIFGVPETKDVGALLRELRERNEQLAVVLDEYGAVAGIVTLEDILEEIVGEIQDEFDLPDARFERLDERTVRAAGSVTIDDLNEALGTALPHDRSRTLAGLVLDALGRRPDPGDTISVAGSEIRVDTLDGLRITALSVTVPDDRDV